jgi:hypothetical protein
MLHSKDGARTRRLYASCLAVQRPALHCALDSNHFREEAMLLDVRTYTCRPGTIKKHLALYERLGKGPQTRHLGEPFAYLVTETGNVNQYIHIWAYENAADREKRRAAMQADPEWQAFLEESSKLGALEHQQNQLMTPVSFFPLKR